MEDGLSFIGTRRAAPNATASTGKNRNPSFGAQLLDLCIFQRGPQQMKRTLLAVLATAVLAASPAMGQNPPAQSGPNNSAVNSSGQNNSSAPVAGRNSFTESQAKSRIEQAGYS